MRPTFIRVAPDEVERHGAAGAIVLAHIRFRCESDGPDRIVVGGLRWWRVSYHEIGHEIGMSFSAVRRTLERLANTVEVAHHPPLEDRRRSYRIASEQPQYESDIPESSHNTNPYDHVPDSYDHLTDSAHPSYESDTCTTTRELREVRDKEGELVVVDAELIDTPSQPVEQISNQRTPAIAGLPDLSRIPPEPAPYCSRHMPDGTEQPCGRCADARRNYTRWEKRYGAAWELLHPPLVGKAEAKALATLAATERLIARMEARRDEQSPQLEPPRYRCRTCRDENIVLNSDGLPGATIRICNHDNTWRPATAEELEHLSEQNPRLIRAPRPAT